MYYVDLPNAAEIGELNLVRSDACVSIYVPTTPLTQDIEKSRIELGNLVKQAISQLQSTELNKRRVWPIQEHFENILADEEFWAHQANSLAILATPETLRVYRLANKLTASVEVSDRFHLQPLLRAIAFPHTAHILALSENAVRVIEVSADLPPKEVDVPDMPKDAATGGGKPTTKDYVGAGHRHGAAGDSFYMTRYVRKIDAALRTFLKGSNHPMVLASTNPLDSLFRKLSSTAVLPDSIPGNPEHVSALELAKAARPLLDAHYATQIQAFHRLFDERAGQNRTTTDIANAARLATFGDIDTLLIDMDAVVDGFVDDETGVVTLDSKGDAKNYGVIDEIAGRALRTGAKVMAVRKEDIPGGHSLAAITRRPV